MRSHGWARNIKLDRKLKKKYEKIDNRFLFINSGFNIRPTEINAAIGLSQLKKLRKFQKIRNQNKIKIINKLKNSKKWDNQFSFFYSSKSINANYFGFPIFLNRNFEKKRKFIKFLEKKK